MSDRHTLYVPSPLQCRPVGSDCDDNRDNMGNCRTNNDTVTYKLTNYRATRLSICNYASSLVFLSGGLNALQNYFARKNYSNDL